ncbi:hypothetical protein HNR06_000580 [Nocardiopsis arvandica]|uniref:Uncharacterized protein n=1 Tax=Nocardiopsis sinuspersici TaxID=501010 RepID=A0A7Y9X879_9ACTN|nr:hypothetical protein [Nocardiopsis sinuspersici]NYH50991.1 hypothetical protein [Nocardiopsis sinuspersici]
MSTSPEDREPNDRARDAEGARAADDAPATGAEPSFTPQEGTGTEPSFAPREDSGAEAAAPRGEGEAPAEPGPGGALSAETLALTALVLLAVTVFSGQLLQLFTTMVLIGDQPVPVDQVTQFSIQVIISGLSAAVAALVAGISLLMTRAGTRPWARWVATTALIVSLLLVLLAVVTYILMPAGTEMQQPPF